MEDCVGGTASVAPLKVVVGSVKHTSDRVTKWATLNIGEFGTTNRNLTCIQCLPDIPVLQKFDGFRKSVQQVHCVKRTDSVRITLH